MAADLLALQGRNQSVQARMVGAAGGEEWVATIDLTGITEVRGVGVELGYDPAVLEYVGVEGLTEVLSVRGESAYLDVAKAEEGRLWMGAMLKRGYETVPARALQMRVHFRRLGSQVGDQPVSLVRAAVVDDNRMVDQLVPEVNEEALQESAEGSYRLAAWPNPSNPSTLISFVLPRESRVRLEVYDLLGQRVRTLVADEIEAAGRHSVNWDGKNQSDVALASGTYLVRLRAGDRVQSQKIALVR